MQMLMTSPLYIPATRRMHVGKELEQYECIDWYDNEARFYDPLLVRFTTSDPLALSYPFLSPPYAYCANDPVNNVDLNGKKIRFAKGVPSDFKQQFSTAIKILNEHNIGGIFAKLEQRPEIIFITEGKNQFDPSNNTISWNPTEGMITDKLS